MGPEKILFGSDFPLLPLDRYLKQLDESGIAGLVRDGILGGNAHKLLKGAYRNSEASLRRTDRGMRKLPRT